MTRTLAHSLHLLARRNKWDFKLWSAYDLNQDLMPQYLPAQNFKGFGTNRFGFVLQSLFNAQKPNVVIISHINLALIGLIIKTINPKCNVWLIAHGIEVWRPLTMIKKMFLKRCDRVMCVSNFTKHEITTRHHINPDKCIVLNNAVDPFMKLPERFKKPEHLLSRYQIATDDRILFTLTRLASSEQYKGHDQVIKAVSRLKRKFPNIKYVLSGKYDDKEELRIKKLIIANAVQDQVILTGFIPENELSDYFLMADIFVLPSKKEGFGIVFVEALACGLPVICGNADGSVDAIRNGELGIAINADDIEELENAIIGVLETPLTEEKRYSLQHRCLENFNAIDYMNKLEKAIFNG